jgi:hypothetical protein
MSDADERSRTAAAKSRAADDTRVLERPRMDAWSPASALEMPTIGGDYRLRWIAEYVNGTHTPRNVQSAIREGYERVRISELPEDFIVDEDLKGDGYARTGGLILMRLPEAFARQRDQYYANRSKSALEGANELQGIAGRNSVYEDRGTRTLSGADAGAALNDMSRASRG